MDNKKLNLVFISLTGNTLSFVKLLKEELLVDYLVNLINIKEIKNTDEYSSLLLQDKSFIFVPTYLDGGNGIDNGTTEILTTPLREFLRRDNNYKYCLGVIGSGNKNFNEQYCLTAKQYSEEFKIPFIDDYELRGTDSDISRIANKIKKMMEG